MWFRRLQWLAVACACLSLSGAHWGIAQGFAWAKMVAEFTQHATLPQAVLMAVSGEYPCGLCRQISEQKKEKTPHQLSVLVDAKKNAPLPPQLVVAPYLHERELIYFYRESSYLAPLHTPPTPPPRVS